MRMDRRTFLAGALAVSAAPGSKPVFSIDCTEEHPPERFFSNGPTHVAVSSAGRYRETSGKPGARFGYRVPIEHPEKPHLAVIRYPDDKRRYMCVMDGTTYDMSTGVFTGGVLPLTGRMLTIENVFWTRFRDASLVFMSWGEAEPAAVAGFDIYELDDLPPLEIPAGGEGRELGIQYEDPCGGGSSEGAIDRDTWLDHVIRYARHTGQTRFVYPMAWYHGPQFPSVNEPADAMEDVVAADRRQYSRWTTQPADWYAGMLERFERHGLEYQASLTLLRLGSLMRRMNLDEEAVRNGAGTINNVLWNGHVQAGTQDWTPLYNARNYNAVLDYYAQGKDMKDFPWAYGEKSRQPYHGGPIFNPLHPAVRQALVTFIGEIATRYARYPAFKGISINCWHATLIWFGSLHSGYDDVTVAAFQTETGIGVPGKPREADRFARRYDFLAQNARPAWIEWRCRKIRSLIAALRDVVVKARPDLRLTLTMWSETLVPQILGGVSAAHQIYARKSGLELWREAGIDPAMLASEPGIELDLQLEPERDASGWGNTGAHTPPDKTHMFRDHDFLDAETLDAVNAFPHSGALIFNSWVEAWGKHRWFRAEASDTQAASLAVMDGKPVEGIFRINSEYPPDGFWWDSQARITAGFPSGVHFLEHYAHAVAEFDALRITRGGLFLDKAHTGQIRRFAEAYRALPKCRFHTLGQSTDPVAVRWLVQRDRFHFYIVNREYYPLRVTLTFASGEVRELALGPYDLQSFSEASSSRLNNFTVHVPAAIREPLFTDARAALESFNRARQSGRLIPGMDRMAAGIESAMREERLAWLRRALTSYIVVRAR